MTHPIEEESYRILGTKVDLGHVGPAARAVIERVIHASADLDFATSMRVTEEAAAAGVRALRAEAPVIVDVRMVAAGITGYPTLCPLEEEVGTEPTRSAAAMRSAAARYPVGAVFVIGCAPTALAEVVRLTHDGSLTPALVIGLPIGMVLGRQIWRLVDDAVGLDLVPQVPTVVYLLVPLALGTGLALIALPTERAARTPPSEALRVD